MGSVIELLELNRSVLRLAARAGSLLVLVLVLAVSVAACGEEEVSLPPGIGQGVIPVGMEGAEASEYLVERLIDIEGQIDAGEIEFAWPEGRPAWDSLTELRRYLRELQVQVARPPILLRLSGSRPQSSLLKMQADISSWPEVRAVRPWREAKPSGSTVQDGLPVGVWVDDYPDIATVVGRLQPLLGPEDDLEQDDPQEALEEVADMVGYLESVSRPSEYATPTTPDDSVPVPSPGG